VELPVGHRAIDRAAGRADARQCRRARVQARAVGMAGTVGENEGHRPSQLEPMMYAQLMAGMRDDQCGALFLRMSHDGQWRSRPADEGRSADGLLWQGFAWRAWTIHPSLRRPKMPARAIRRCKTR